MLLSERVLDLPSEVFWSFRVKAFVLLSGSVHVYCRLKIFALLNNNACIPELNFLSFNLKCSFSPEWKWLFFVWLLSVLVLLREIVLVLMIGSVLHYWVKALVLLSEGILVFLSEAFLFCQMKEFLYSAKHFTRWVFLSFWVNVFLPSENVLDFPSVIVLVLLSESVLVNCRVKALVLLNETVLSFEN